MIYARKIKKSKCKCSWILNVFLKYLLNQQYIYSSEEEGTFDVKDCIPILRDNFNS